MGKYSGKVALVTGSRRGVGKLITEHFLEEDGMVIGFARGESGTDHTRYRHYQLDVADIESVQRAFESIRTTTDSIDIVVNNAAVGASQYALVMPPSAAEAMLRVNVLAPFLISREAAKLMRKRAWGRIVNISSMQASLEPAGGSMYAATKAAVRTLANVMAKEFATFNVTCNTLAISAIDTDMMNQVPGDKIASAISGLPLPRLAVADDILNVIDFFASERSSYITAQAIFLGGVS